MTNVTARMSINTQNTIVYKLYFVLVRSFRCGVTRRQILEVVSCSDIQNKLGNKIIIESVHSISRDEPDVPYIIQLQTCRAQQCGASLS